MSCAGEIYAVDFTLRLDVLEVLFSERGEYTG